MIITSKLTEAQKIEAANADPTLSPYYVSVLYADFGKRKTTTAVSMVKERGLLLSTDDSLNVLVNPSFKPLLDKFRIIKLEGLTQFQYINLEFDDRTGQPYDTIIWDTASKTIDRYLDLLSTNADWGGKYRDVINSTHAELKGDTSLRFLEHKFHRDQARPVLDKLFNETKAHIVITSQMTKPIPGMGKNQQERPRMPEATFAIIGERADIIGQLIPGNRGKFLIDVSDNSLTLLGKSRIETIQGRMDLDTFVANYKEFVF